MDNPYFIQVKTLQEEPADPGRILVDVRERSDYGEGHIPGAINIREIFDYLVTSENGGCEAMRAGV